MYANRWRRLEIPLTGIVLLERLVREYPGWAYFDEIPTELALKHAILMPAKIHIVVRCKDIEVIATSIVLVEPDAAVASDAAIHLVINEGAKVLVPVRALLKTRPAVIVSGHDCHVLEVALAAFITDGTVMGMVSHEPFDDASAERFRIRIID